MWRTSLLAITNPEINTGQSMRYRQLSIVVLATVTADQTTKAIALVWLDPTNPIGVLPGLNLTLGFNEGVSFGMMSSAMSGRPFALAVATGALTLVLAILALKAGEVLERAGFGLIVGGSLGNIADRLRQGAVTDFLDLYWGEWRWPTFNVADIAIVLGVGAVLAATWITGRKPATNNSDGIRAAEHLPSFPRKRLRRGSRISKP